jgi:hypothetical protein
MRQLVALAALVLQVLLVVALLTADWSSARLWAAALLVVVSSAVVATR